MESKKTKYCVYCGKEISEDAKRCLDCGEWLDESSLSRNHTPYTYTSKNNIEEDIDTNNNLENNSNSFNNSNTSANLGNGTEYSRILPIRRLFLLMILTLGLYSFYWIYKTNCYLRDDLGKDVSPGVRTFLMIIPIANIIVFYQTLGDMNQFIKQEKIETYSSGLNTLIWIFLGWLLSFWVFINVQESINELWRIKEANLPVRREFSNSEIVVMTLGAILWIAYFLLIMIISILGAISGTGGIAI